jgi:hypothetical protein
VDVVAGGRDLGSYDSVAASEVEDVVLGGVLVLVSWARERGGTGWLGI